MLSSLVFAQPQNIILQKKYSQAVHKLPTTSGRPPHPDSKIIINGHIGGDHTKHLGSKKLQTDTTHIK